MKMGQDLEISGLHNAQKVEDIADEGAFNQKIEMTNESHVSDKTSTMEDSDSDIDLETNDTSTHPDTEGDDVDVPIDQPNFNKLHNEEQIEGMFENVSVQRIKLSKCLEISEKISSIGDKVKTKQIGDISPHQVMSESLNVPTTSHEKEIIAEVDVSEKCTVTQKVKSDIENIELEEIDISSKTNINQISFSNLNSDS